MSSSAYANHLEDCQEPHFTIDRWADETEGGPQNDGLTKEFEQAFGLTLEGRTSRRTSGMYMNFQQLSFTIPLPTLSIIWQIPQETKIRTQRATIS